MPLGQLAVARSCTRNTVPLGHSDFSSVINRIRSEKLIDLCTLVGDSDVAFARQYHAAGFNPEEMPVASLDLPEVEVAAIGGEAAVGAFLVRALCHGLPVAREREIRRRLQGALWGRSGYLHFVSEAALSSLPVQGPRWEKIDPGNITPQAIRAMPRRG